MCPWLLVPVSFRFVIALLLVLFRSALLCFALLCFVFALLCFALLCFVALLCFALLVPVCFAMILSTVDL
jgi:hypothetical protein